jgi:surface antigen
MKAPVVLFLMLFALVSTSCGPGFRLNELPHEQAKVEDLGGVPTPAESDAQGSNPLPGDTDAPKNQPPTPSEDSPKNTPQEETQRPDPQSLIEMAKWVIQNESKKVGPACNLFVQRVLQLMGFERKNFLANNFDWYAKDKFSSYQLESFSYDSNRSQLPRLHDYIWSFPEGTGFIMQWKQKSGHGHIAIVQRVGETLVIYHAGLNTFNPKAQTIPLERLLHRRRSNYTLNVFSNIKK